MKRRNFIGQGLAGLSIAPALLSNRAHGKHPGPNDKVRVGFIGVGNRGSQLLHSFMLNSDCEVAALCDVYEPMLTRDPNAVEPEFPASLGGWFPKLGEKFVKQPQCYSDYRELLDRKDIDAVCIATPDHWHALQTIDALHAGKDVYCEKPLTQTIVEGRKMLDAEAAGDRIVTVGLPRRGAPVYQELAKMVHQGLLGKITLARIAYVSNMFPAGIGKCPPRTPPKGLDWNAWLGPRAWRDYRTTIAPYKFRWQSDFSSQMGNWGVHYFDTVRWLTGERAPIAVTAVCGNKSLDDDRDIPDNALVNFEFASGMLLSFTLSETTGLQIMPRELCLAGNKAALYANVRGYEIIPATNGQFQKKVPNPIRAAQRNENKGTGTDELVRNFLDCVKSREKSWCTLEEGLLSTSMSHIANIALKVGKRLEWDSSKERFTNCEEANQYLSYEYRAPWKLS